MRALLTTAALIAAVTPAFADSTQGTVVAFDRVAKVLVLEDKTVWSLETLKDIPADLKSGDDVTIDFTSNADNGWGKINAIVIGG
jgi:hypothetical protein